MCREVNGYSNYETWNVHLHIDNDREMSAIVHERAKKWRRVKDKEIKLTDWLEKFFEDQKPELTGPNADLLGNAWAKVNFLEIAERIYDK